MTIRTMASKPSISKYNDQDHIFYSKYGKTHSDIYAIPIVEETRNVFDYCSSIYNYNGVFAPDERSHLLTLNLSPYSSNSQFSIVYPASLQGAVVNSQLDFRFLYTGREYNIETGDYYYRARVMDSSVGRFSSKDPVLYLNLYRYVKNNPVSLHDPSGKFTNPFDFASGMLEFISSNMENALNSGTLMPTLENNDDYQHCMGTCYLTQMYGWPFALTIQFIHELFTKGNKKDTKADNRAAWFGASIGGTNADCSGACAHYSNKINYYDRIPMCEHSAIGFTDYHIQGEMDFFPIGYTPGDATDINCPR